MSSEQTPYKFRPLLTTTDWNEEWKKLQSTRHAADDVLYWDERSKTFGSAHGDAVSPYAARFIELADIHPEDTVFDMGCGNGAIACPLAQNGHHVLAADFSKGMIDSLEKKCERLGITPIETKIMSWDDDWTTHGIMPESFDVALASRSIVTADLQDSLERLTSVARRRACITLTTGSSPRTDERILKEIGVHNLVSHDYLYAFMILVSMGYHPDLSYISSKRFDTYDNKEEAYENLKKMVEHAMQADADANEIAVALNNLSTWLDKNLIINSDAGKPTDDGHVQKAFKLKSPRIINWAFIGWNKEH